MWTVSPSSRVITRRYFAISGTKIPVPDSTVRLPLTTHGFRKSTLTPLPSDVGPFAQDLLFEVTSRLQSLPDSIIASPLTSYAMTRKLYVVVFRSPSAKRLIRRVEMSTVRDSSSKMSSAITMPTAGESLKPWPLKPVQM